jgi:hypothetical protein
MQTVTTAASERRQSGLELPRWAEIWLKSGSVLLYLWFLLWTCSTPFRSHAPLVQYTEDDFYYYLKIAQNFASGHGSSFDGIHLTNGYHPLWFLVFVGLSLFSTTLQGAILTVALTSLVSAVATFFLIRKILLVQGLNDLLACGISILITHNAIGTYLQGMETTLAIPLMLLTIIQGQRFLSNPIPSQGLKLGALMGITILSRIDTALWMCLLGGAAIAAPEVRRSLRPRVLLCIAVGLLPVGMYLLLDHHYFDSWLPISGAAKQLKPTLAPSIRPLRSLAQKGILIPCALAVLSLAVIGTRWKYSSVVERAVYVPTLLFPFVYYGALCFLSDWPLWGWYSYPTIAQFTVAAGICVAWLLRPLNRSQTLSAVACIAICVNYGHKLTWHQIPEITDASLDIARFSETHPGVYAMGDRAGSAGFLMSSPLIQLEGLVMDKPFLENIKSQRSLKQVLQQYGVRYYIASIRGDYTGVVNAREPAQAGPASPRMTGVFTERPVALFRHGHVTTVVFDLQSTSPAKTWARTLKKP